MVFFDIELFVAKMNSKVGAAHNDYHNNGAGPITKRRHLQGMRGVCRDIKEVPISESSFLPLQRFQSNKGDPENRHKEAPTSSLPGNREQVL